MATVAECAADDGFLLALMTAMTAELVVVYDLPPDARPRPLDPASRYLLARDGPGRSAAARWSRSGRACTS
ncbi:hypothetical protein QRX60_34575 [Amycolatopsis mongoliensis]|uniref:Uncharacterized protein n=1 Tax=Amycolatopsis mongoliensis TaxID=715475 RepID=A0A9Y2JKJ3_9PSEU|nr:hypothetical protein [Amycolatopsis sp. 4-36]WIX99150.1 hypothetical protein QRX60_34575 [Amycolatopsis sp. 4-36]